MEEDIIESLISFLNENGDENYQDYINSIENLISRYKELEKYKKYYETEKIIWSRKDYISKSKVKEKIEELKKKMEEDEADEFGIHSIGWGCLDYVIQVLQELLEES